MTARSGTTTTATGPVAWTLLGAEHAEDRTHVPVVALHGVTDAGRCWEPVAAAWTGDRAVLTVDARGHGGTPLGADGRLAMSTLAQDAAAVVREVLGRDVVALGHSMGGLVAEELAITEPGLVAALVLEDPAWRRDRDVDARGVLRWLPDAVASRTEGRLALLERSHRENPGWPEDEHLAWAAARAALDPRLADGPHLWDERDWVEALRDVAAPVTLITGDPARGAIVDDAIVARAGELLGDRLSRAHAPGAGHCVRREARADVLAAVDVALAAADARAAQG